MITKIVFKFKRFWVYALVLLGATVNGLSQIVDYSDSTQWKMLLKDNKIDEVQVLCTDWLDSGNSARKVEAHKCLANIALYNDRGIMISKGNDAGGELLSGAPTPEARVNSMRHLNAALQLAPQDLSLHRGRLHLLEISFLFEEMAEALDESCTTYKGNEGVQPWLPYTTELFHEKHYRAALMLLGILDRHYPNSHEVLGNIGAAHIMLNEDEEAIRYLKRAVALAPQDPTDTWNLARIYDFSGNTTLADQWYQKALVLETDLQKKRTQTCVYTKFLREKRNDMKRACELQKDNCPDETWNACSPKEQK